MGQGVQDSRWERNKGDGERQYQTIDNDGAKSHSSNSFCQSEKKKKTGGMMERENGILDETGFCEWWTNRGDVQR